MRLLWLLLIALTSFAVPQWYHNLEKQGASYYVGYGQGKSEAEAKRNALNDIATQISVKVESLHSSEMGVQHGDTFINVRDASSLSAIAQIHGYDVLKLGYEEGIYYIAVAYENIPSIDKFNRKLSKLASNKPEMPNCYLKSVPIASIVKKKVNFSLRRKDGLWYIGYRDILQPLDKKDFLRFFASTNNPALQLATNKKGTLYEGDEFYFNVTSGKNGYVTLFTVYEDGTVATLVRNIPVKKNRAETIPDKDFESVLQAGLIKSGVETFDLYVAVFTKEKKYYDQFARADEGLIDDERYKNFDELITLLDGMIFTSLKVVTKPR